MKLRIARRTARMRITVLDIDGELVREGATELRRLCEGVRGRLRLDLSNLRAADGDGILALKELRRQGAELVGVSPYIGLRLHRAGDD